LGRRSGRKNPAPEGDADVLEAAGLTAHSAVSIRLLDSGEIRLRPIGKVVPAEPNGVETTNVTTSTESESEWEQW
jgi:hypothetical protein